MRGRVLESWVDIERNTLKFGSRLRRERERHKSRLGALLSMALFFVVTSR